MQQFHCTCVDTTYSIRNVSLFAVPVCDVIASECVWVVAWLLGTRFL